MKKIYKISIIVCSFLLIMGISQFALAAGKGYFIEVSDFVMFYNNIRVSGYLVIEDNLTNQEGKLGDLLIEKTFNLDRDSVVNFCTNSRDVTTNAPQNRNCTWKDMTWIVQSAGANYKSVLTIENPNLFQLSTSKILAANSIAFTPANGRRVITEDPVRVTGCLVNDGSGSCGGNQVKTNKVYLGDLNFISRCVSGSNIYKMCNNDDDCGDNGSCNYNITFNPFNLELGNIDLGSEDNFANQNLCYKTSDTCDGSAALVGEAWNFQNPNFMQSGTEYGCWNPSSAKCVNGARLCCFLDVSY